MSEASYCDKYTRLIKKHAYIFRCVVDFQYDIGTSPYKSEYIHDSCSVTEFFSDDDIDEDYCMDIARELISAGDIYFFVFTIGWFLIHNVNKPLSLIVQQSLIVQHKLIDSLKNKMSKIDYFFKHQIELTVEFTQRFHELVYELAVLLIDDTENLTKLLTKDCSWNSEFIKYLYTIKDKPDVIDKMIQTYPDENIKIKSLVKLSTNDGKLWNKEYIQYIFNIKQNVELTQKLCDVDPYLREFIVSNDTEKQI